MFAIIYRIIVLVSVFFVVFDIHHVTSECVVRKNDCSYSIRIPVAPDSFIWLEGTPVRILQQQQQQQKENDGTTTTTNTSSTWIDLTCHKVIESSPSSWELDYDILTLRIQNIKNIDQSSKDDDDTACILSFTANDDIPLGGGGGGKNSFEADTIFSTFPSFVWSSDDDDNNNNNSGRNRNSDDDSEGNTTYDLPSSSSLKGSLSWYGSFMQPQVNQGCSTGTRGGPCVLYDLKDPIHGTAVVLSALDHFLTTTTTTTTVPTTKGNKKHHEDDVMTNIVWGASTMASMIEIPAGYTHSFVVVVGQDGITDTVHQWGQLLRHHYQLTNRNDDITIQTLGYQTDNGGQYCFCQENCDEALLKVLHELHHPPTTDEYGSGGSGGGSHHPVVVPVRYLSYQNAWWPTSRSAPWCVTDWGQWNTRKVPMGVPEFSKRVGLPLQLYAPYFCNDTVYATNFTFLSSTSTTTKTINSLCKGFDFRQITPSQSYDFYSFLFQQGISYGMSSYEIDFVNQNLNCLSEFQSNVESAEQVFTGMALAATHWNITMQWCYATPAAALQSLNYPSVTNMRASFDYYYGSSWDIGLSSLFLWAVDIAPSTDTFWTSDNGEVATTMGGCDKTGCPDDHQDAGCELHTILAVMSTGPVGFSDALHQTNAKRILRTCKADGVLLQPNKPLTTLDGHLGQPWRVMQSFSGPIDATTTRIRNEDYPVWAYYVVAHRLQALPNQQLSVTLDELWPRPKRNSLWFLVWNGGGDGSLENMDTSTHHPCQTNGAGAELCGSFVTADNDRVVNFHEVIDVNQATRASLFPACRSTAIQSSFTTTTTKGWVLLGELSKYTSMSKQRFSDVKCLDDGMGIVFQVNGSPGEVVTVSAIFEGHVHVQEILLDENNFKGQVVSFGSITNVVDIQ